jgi:hypothetical protein
MSNGRRRAPSEAEWQRLAVVFGFFFATTLAVAAVFIFAAPFPPLVGALIMSPLVVPTGWIWIMVILRRDVDRLRRLNAFAARRRRR